MPKRSNPWTYKKRKRSKKSTNTSEEANIQPINQTDESTSSLNSTKNGEDYPNLVSNPPKTNVIKQEQVQLPRSSVPFKRQSNALIASFGLLDPQKPSVDPPVKIKVEPRNDVSSETSSEVVDDEVETIGAFIPVKKIRTLNFEPVDAAEDIIIIAECIIEKENEDDLLHVFNNVTESVEDASIDNPGDGVQKEELCDTAPSSPVSADVEPCYQINPEELELMKLSLAEPSMSPHNDSFKDEIISEDTFNSLEGNFVGFNNLKILDFDTKNQLVDIYNCSEILTTIQNVLENFKNKVSEDRSFEDSIKTSIRQYNSPSKIILNIHPVIHSQELNTPVIPPPSFAPIKDISPPPKTMPCVSSAPSVFNNRQCARDVFLKDLNVSPRFSPPSIESNLVPKCPTQPHTILENDIDALLNSLKPTMEFLQSNNFDNGSMKSKIQSLPNKNDLDAKNKTIPLESTSNTFSQKNDLSVTEQLQTFPFTITTTAIFPPLLGTIIHPPLPDPVYLPPLPDPVNLPPLPTTTPPIPDAISPLSANINKSQINMDVEPQTSVSSCDSLLRQPHTSVFANENPNLPQSASITNYETQSLNENTLRKRSYPYFDSCESSLSPSSQIDATNDSAPSDPRKNRKNSAEIPDKSNIEIPHKVPRHDASSSGKPSQLTTERIRNPGYLFKDAIAGIRTNQIQLNKQHATHNKTDVGKHSEEKRKKKIDLEDYFNRKSSNSDKESRVKTQLAVPNNSSLRELNKHSVMDHMSHTMKDTIIGRPIEVVTRRFSSENDPRSSVQNNLMLRNSNTILSNMPSNVRISTNQNSFYGNPIPVLSEKRSSEHLSDSRSNLIGSSSPYECMSTPSYNDIGSNNPSTSSCPTSSKITPSNRFLINDPNRPIPMQNDTFGFDPNYTVSNAFNNISIQTLPPLGKNVRENVRIPLLPTPHLPTPHLPKPLLPTPFLLNRSVTSPQLTAAVSPIYSNNSPILAHYPSRSPPSVQLPAPVDLVSNPASHDTNTTSSYRLNQRNFACLVPESVKEDIGKTYVQSQFVYLIMISWSYDWLSEFERQLRPELNLPPILPKSVELSQVRNTYSDEREYYNTYFKLLLFESWFKLYEAWKNNQRCVVQGKISDYEQKNEFNKYVIECFVPSLHIEALPKEGCIVLVTFKSLGNSAIKMLGYVTKSMNRPFAATHDGEHEAYKALSVSENIGVYKFKITIYTAFKVDDINDRELISIQHLLNVRKILQQNDALMNLSKSTLSDAVLSPITSPNKFSASIPKESMDYVSVMDQVCERVSDQAPLLAMVHAEFSLTRERMTAVSYLIKKLQEKQPDAKVIICSKSENSLSDIAMYLKQHNPVYINTDRIPDLKKYSLGKLTDKNVPIFRNAETEEEKAKRMARNHVLATSDVILVLLLGLENDDCSVMKLVKELNIACCILDEAHMCNEPESIIPLTYGIKKYVLLGNKNLLCNVSSYTITYDYNRSLLNRASL